ncbi:AfsR/SARP family transcriptional regulator, partial [Actinocorallia lasiicapitis]
MLRFEVLGPLVVATSGGAPAQVADRRVRALLADLLVHQGQVVAADRLIDHLWGEQLPANPSATLQTRVSQLRKALEEAEPGGRELVVTKPPGYLLQLAPEQVDSHCFRRLVDQARQDQDTRSRAARYVEALALWRGQAYAEFAGEPFAVATAARLEEERLAAVESLAETRLELGEHALVAAELSELISRYPLRERMRAAQMRALYGSGRQTEALDSFQSLRTRLAEELGLDPGQELEALHRAILNQDASLSERAADAGPVGQAADRPAGNLPAALTDLVGRRDLLTDVRDRLRASRVVTLTGPGGVGKTSLALEVGREEAGRHPGGVWLVDLAALPAHAAPEQVTAAVGDLDGLVKRLDALSELSGKKRE